jgi:hypothetical protein
MAGARVPPGVRDFGEVGKAKLNFQKMVRGRSRMKKKSEDVSGDQLNVEKRVKELSDVRMEMFRATGAMFEQEHLRFINMFAATGGGGQGGSGYRFLKAIMEHKVIQCLGAVSGNKSFFRRWHQKYTTALGKFQMHMRR